MSSSNFTKEGGRRSFEFGFFEGYFSLTLLLFLEETFLLQLTTAVLSLDK